MTGEAHQETWIPHYSHHPEIGHTHRVDIWEYSRNCWVAADSSVLSGGNYLNLRGFLPTREAVIKMEEDIMALVDDLLSEILAGEN